MITDPAKLKVVELRAELSSRGLDTKGNKPVLVKRLREALEAECGDELPETSIADTSTEDINSSMDVSTTRRSPSPPPVCKVPDKEPSPPPTLKSEPKSTKDEKVESTGDQPKPVKEMKKEENIEEKDIEPKTDTSKNVEKVDKKVEIKAVTLKVEEPKVKASPEKKEPEIKETPQEKGKIAVKEEKITLKEEKITLKEEKIIVKEEKIIVKVETKVKKEDEPEVMEVVEDDEEDVKKSEEHQEISDDADDVQVIEDDKVKEEDEDSGDVEMIEEKTAEDNKDDDTEPEKETSEPRNRKSRWGSVPDPQPEASETVETAVIAESSVVNSEDAARGEKRRHESVSPVRSLRRRSKSPAREDEPDIDPENMQLSWIDSDLNLCIDKQTFMSAEPMHSDAFGYMWAGARSTHGVDKGKVWYEVKLTGNVLWEEAPKPVEDSDEIPEPYYVLRVGWSAHDATLQLGEAPLSYGYESEGSSVMNSVFTDYGKKFAAEDVVGTFLDLESDPVTINYTVNGEKLDTAFTIPRSELPEDIVLFPHILSRNIKFAVNFGQKEEPWFEPPEELDDYTLIKNVEEKVAGQVRLAKRQDCEVVMMVGLPCCGKSYWVKEHVAKNLDKKYNILGIAHVLEKMKMKGQPRRDNFKSGWTVLLDKCSKCAGKLINVASTRRRNFILDQTNLFSSAQRRKMRPFEGFRRHAVVCVVADDVQTTRENERQQADGKDVPDSAVLEMKASMCLPTVGEWLDEVTYAELNETEAAEAVQKYNKQGREAGYGPNYSSKKPQTDGGDRRKQWNRNPKHDNRNRWGGGSNSGSSGGGRDNRHTWGGNQRTGGGGGGGGNSNWGRHDNRNHHGGGGGGGGSGSGNWRGNANNRMLNSGSNFNRNQGSGGGGGSGYNRNRNQPPHRNQMANKGNWSNQGGGGNWSSQGNWGGQGGWGQGQGGGAGSGGWGQYNSGQGGQGNQQWKGYGAQQYQQNYGQGYPNQYGGQQYANWNYYGQYAQGWNAQSGQGAAASTDATTNAQFNQYTQQQQAAWAQYAQGGYSGYGGTQASTTAATTGGQQQPTTK